MKNTIKILIVILSIVISVSFIGFNRSLDESELGELSKKAEVWLDSELKDNLYEEFINIELSENKIKKSSISVLIRNLIDNADCGALNKNINFEKGEPEVIEDFKIGVRNCANIMFEFSNENPEDLLIDFEMLVRSYKKALRKNNNNEERNVSDNFELIFYKYAHLIRKTNNTPLAPLTFFILGDSAMRVDDENVFMVGPVLLAKAIFKNNLKISKLAFIKLKENIHFGYTGSNGDNTPDSWKEVLNDMSYQIEKSFEKS